MKIGTKEIKGKVVLAPMAGITSYGYRKFFEQFDIGFSYTEMVSDMGTIYGNKETFRLLSFYNKFYSVSAIPRYFKWITQ